MLPACVIFCLEGSLSSIVGRYYIHLIHAKKAGCGLPLADISRIGLAAG
jgi:hypothetical protein